MFLVPFYLFDLQLNMEEKMRKQPMYLAAEGLEYREPYRQQEQRTETRLARERPFYGFEKGCALEDCPEALKTRTR